jgi:Fe-S oxidoreductase
MTIDSVFFALVLVGSFVMFGRSISRLIKVLKTGKPENRFGDPGARLRKVLGIALGQSKLLREPLAGALHALIFWGFLVLLTAIAESIGEGLFSGFSLSFLGPVYPVIAFLADLFGAVVIATVLVSMLRRLFFPPKRLQVAGHSRSDALMVLSCILVVMLTMFGQNASRIVMEGASGQEPRVISAMVAGLFAPDSAGLWHRGFLWAHMIAVLGFLNYLPTSKHLHIISSIPNVYFSRLGPVGALSPINLADETLTKFGATDVSDLTWKQLLNGYTCTECGRCTSVCPASTTGKQLNPKKIMTDIRARSIETATAAGEGTRQLLDDFISEQELWACTTCMACVQECPVMIEHVDTIVELRRGLVLNESRFPDELKTTFANLERNSTPWGFGHAARAEWADGLNIPVLSDVRSTELLFWVGCAGSYDARYRRVSRAFARLLQIANVPFAILGPEEKCTGDPARRMGNEYLAQSLMAENIATLNGYGVKRIVVTCPHCMQSLGKEYRQFGGTYEVVHHTTFLADLIAGGKLTVPSGRPAAATFHDPCYLGRYNGVYDEPRTLLADLGLEVREMGRTKDRSFCCGAGGGRMWMEEKEGKRINTERAEEALATQSDVIATGCPFCMTMMTDGVKEKNAADTTSVKDVAELLLEAIEGQTTRGKKE